MSKGVRWFLLSCIVTTLLIISAVPPVLGELVSPWRNSSSLAQQEPTGSEQGTQGAEHGTQGAEHGTQGVTGGNKETKDETKAAKKAKKSKKSKKEDKKDDMKKDDTAN